VRFADFVQPGNVLTVTAEILSIGERDVQLKTQGSLDGHTAVSGRLIIERYNLADTQPELAATDAYLRQHLRDRLALVYRSEGESTSHPGTGASSQPSEGKV
jgi:3-hydroxyacyl-[acyl-carrier-protein] dehydratase